MNRSHENRVAAGLGAGLAIISPDGKEGMIQHARECAEAALVITSYSIHYTKLYEWAR